MQRELYELIEELLELLEESEGLQATVTGSFVDAAIAGGLTLLGGLFGGREGAFMGATAGAAVLGVSTLMDPSKYKSLMTVLRQPHRRLEQPAGAAVVGVSTLIDPSKYKSLMTVLREDFTQAEREALYDRLCQRLRPLVMYLVGMTASRLMKVLKDNPGVMKDVLSMVNDLLKTKNMKLA